MKMIERIACLETEVINLKENISGMKKILWVLVSANLAQLGVIII